MAAIQITQYKDIFRVGTFRRFWMGYTISILGDSMTRVALTWLVFERTGSPQALGLLTVAYTAPVFIGGLLAGVILDRYERRVVMLADSILRGLVVLLVPVLALLGLLGLWYVYVVAAIHGLLMMIPLAGGPSIVPSLVGEEHLDTANALESLSFTLGNVVGPPLAGVLIAWVGAPNVILIDALSYFLFALSLLGIHIPDTNEGQKSEVTGGSHSLLDAAHLLLHDPVLLSTTLMFMAANVGLGTLLVWLPIYSNQIGTGGPQVYGVLLGFMAAGEVTSSFLAGSLKPVWPLGLQIALTQFLGGASLILLLLGARFVWIVPGLCLLGFFTAPMTIWGQTLRMQIIPAHLRGRTFALLRTLMQGALPIGGAAGGFLLPVLGIPTMIALSGAFIGLPGLAGLQIGPLRAAGSKMDESEKGTDAAA